MPSKFYYIIASLLIVSSSCQKVIDINLNSVSPKMVIQGNVTDQPGPYVVQLSKTINFSDPNVFPEVTGATVVINDNIGNTETLTEVSPGLYKTSTLAGVPGRNYILTVNSGGKQYQAVSSMPAAVEIDTIEVDSFSFGGPNSNKFLNVKFQDPAGIDNFYRIIEVINDDTLNIINVTDDQLQDGKQISFPVFSDEDPKLKSGDNVKIIFQCIDKKVYHYYLELIDVINSGGSAAPANPTSNFSNSALGYFSAHSQRVETLVIP